MSLSALTYTTGGTKNVPISRKDWDGWISATSTHNYMLDDTLVDWLDRYGKDKGFIPDTDKSNYHDERLAYMPFIRQKGRKFEEALFKHLSSLKEVITIAESLDDARDLAAANRTFQALVEEREIIYQAVLRDAESQTYGIADFLIRSDILNSLFPDHLSSEEALTAAPALNNSRRHYVAVDAKFTTLTLNASGELGNSGSALAYKAQLYIYNRALGRLQGYTPPKAFLIGRNWKKGNFRGSGAMECLGPISMSDNIGTRVEAATDWLRKMREEGGKWNPLPSPSISELWPNAGGNGGIWNSTIKNIAGQLNELTMLWGVGPKKRNAAIREGISSWRDSRVTPKVLGITGENLSSTLQAILDVNQTNEGPPVRPSRISTEGWRAESALEFFVDFETVSNLNDDFAAFPRQGGQALIFMIGCGHMENGKWVFHCFIADRLNEASEAQMIDKWLAHMNVVRSQMGSEDATRVIHWSNAEAINYENSYESVRKRHSGKGWPLVNWFDILKKVVQREPVVVRGALKFGLKEFALALHNHGLIKTSWGNSHVDGRGAMTGAWWCEHHAAENSLHLTDIDLMKEIKDYNEVDCKVMMEILHYLRKWH